MSGGGCPVTAHGNSPLARMGRSLTQQYAYVRYEYDDEMSIWITRPASGQGCSTGQRCREHRLPPPRAENRSNGGRPIQ